MSSRFEQKLDKVLNEDLDQIKKNKMKMNKKDIEQLAAFITEDPREFNLQPPKGTIKEYYYDPEEAKRQDEAGHTHSDIKVNAQEREAQKRELADIVKQGQHAQQFLSYIESIEHMSQSGLEY
jgi:hypothetical protein